MVKRKFRHFAGILSIGLATAVACGQRSDTSEHVAKVRQALTVDATLEIPTAFTLYDFAMGARGTLKLNDRALVGGSVLNSGATSTELGVDTAVSGDVVSEASVLLRNNAEVGGSVTTEGELTLNPGAAVGGDVEQGVSFDELTRSLTVQFADNQPGLTPTQNVSLQPGNYGALTVNSGIVVTLGAGTYTFASITFNQGSTLRFDDTAGPVILLAAGNVALRATITKLNAGDSNLLVGTLGTGSIQVDTAFSGALLAPNAKVNLQSAGPFLGQVYAKDIELHQDLIWTHYPFAAWEDILTPLPSDSDGSEGNPGDLPMDPVGDAIRAYISAITLGTSESQQAAALDALRNQPQTEVVTALENARLAATDPNEAWTYLFVLSRLKTAPALPVFTSLLDQPIPDELQKPLDSHDAGLLESGRLIVRTTLGLTGLALAGIAGARDAVLNVIANHPLSLVRGTAIHQVERHGDADFKDELRDRMRPEDTIYLNPGDSVIDSPDPGVPDPGEISSTAEPPALGEPSGDPPGEPVPTDPSCGDGLQNGDEEGVDCGGSCPEACDGSGCEPTMYQAETMFHSTGGAYPGGWNVWTNGYISFDHEFSAGPATLSVRAFGEVALGVWPNMTVTVDGTSIGTVSVDSASYEDYEFSFEASGGSQEVRIHFDNDFYSPPLDRNLIVDSASVDCQDDTPPGDSLVASLIPTTDWGQGYCVVLSVENGTSAPVSGWSVSVDLNASTTYTTWNGTFSGSAGLIQIAPQFSWNQSIPAGATDESIGFCANRDSAGTNLPIVVGVSP